MCKFFSAVSDGKGRVEFFKLEDIVRIMSSGNPEGYDFNSHTSILHSLGIKGKDEDVWNKWEYEPETKTLTIDGAIHADDSVEVQKKLDGFFVGKGIGYLRNLYNRNSGYGNSGDWNSGGGNSGYWNSGNGNSGNCNSGNCNSGSGNSGDWNSGNRNSGCGNSGDRNSGYGNSGDWNSGGGNSGDWNSGNCNSGSGNSGNWNSGYGNSGNGILNSFCTKRQWMLFDKPCTKEQYEKIDALDWSWFFINRWVSESDMSDQEKKDHPSFKTCSGYLKTIDYKEAFKACPESFIDAVKKLKNFDKKKFKEISGLEV